jgi:hypothetical protein
MEMSASWLEAWELPMPVMAWEGKGSSEQVQEEDGIEVGDTGYLLGDVDLLGLDSTSESPPVDLTMLIENLLDEEPVSALTDSPTKLPDLICSSDPSELLQPESDMDSNQALDWVETIISMVPVTVDMNDLQATCISPNYLSTSNQNTDCDYPCEDMIPTVEEITVGDKRKTARKRRLETGIPGPSGSDPELESSSGAEKKSRSQTTVLDKNSPEYRMRRDRNNKFVRASREKSRRRQQEVEDSLNRVTVENTELRKKVDSLTREVEILRGLFVSIGAEIPRDVVDRINTAMSL